MLVAKILYVPVCSCWFSFSTNFCPPIRITKKKKKIGKRKFWFISLPTNIPVAKLMRGLLLFNDACCHMQILIIRLFWTASYYYFSLHDGWMCFRFSTVKIYEFKLEKSKLKYFWKIWNKNWNAFSNSNNSNFLDWPSSKCSELISKKKIQYIQISYCYYLNFIFYY